MKVFYYITAHKNPNQLLGLVNVLKADASIICIHIDDKSNLADFRDKIAKTSTVFFIKNPVNVFWSGFSQVEATLKGMREFVKSDADFFVSLSAQDFPIKPTNSLHDFLKKHLNTNFIIAGLTETNWKEASLRISSIRYIDFFEGLRNKFKMLRPLIDKAEGLINKSLTVLGKRKLPYGFKLYGGSSWFVLNKAAINYILKTISDKPLLYSFFKKTVCADEHFFHTILGNSDILPSVIHNNLRYVKFQNNKSNPEILTIKDYETLIAEPAFFARKFDMETHPDIIDKLKEYIRKQ